MARGQPVTGTVLERRTNGRTADSVETVSGGATARGGSGSTARSEVGR